MMTKSESRSEIRIRAKALSEHERMAIAMLAGPLAIWLAFAAISTIDIQGVAQTLTAIGVYLPAVSIG